MNDRLQDAVAAHEMTGNGHMTMHGFQNFLSELDCPGFLIDEEILQFSQHLVNQERVGEISWGDLKVPTDAMRHGKTTAIALPVSGCDGELKVFVLNGRSDRHELDLGSVVYAINQRGPLHLGSFTPGGSICLADELVRQLSNGELEKFYMIVSAMAFILSIINQPRMLRRDPLVSRQQRRAAERSGISHSNCWHRVSWDISKETKDKVSQDPSYRKVALHWRRGHFRRAEPHYKEAIQRPDAIRKDEREMWWQWIEGQWVGHPAFGIKKSIHAPKLSTGDAE